MKTAQRVLLAGLVLALVTACGYTNPNVYNGPEKSIYMVDWKNRTSKLTLDSKLYKAFSRWFQKANAIHTVRSRKGADLILAGEIISIELPSLSYGANRVATEVKVELRVRYILKEIATNKILLEMPNELWTEKYLVSSSSNTNLDNEEKALETIVDNIAKKIYQRTVVLLPKLQSE